MFVAVGLNVTSAAAGAAASRKTSAAHPSACRTGPPRAAVVRDFRLAPPAFGSPFEGGVGDVRRPVTSSSSRSRSRSRVSRALSGGGALSDCDSLAFIPFPSLFGCPQFHPVLRPCRQGAYPDLLKGRARTPDPGNEPLSMTMRDAIPPEQGADRALLERG